MLKKVKFGKKVLYIYPTFKGLVSEGDDVEEAFSLLDPGSVCVSLSDREIAEVRWALREEGEEDPAAEDDYIPESAGMKRMLGVGPVEPEDQEGDDEDEEGDDEDEDEEPDGIPDELDMPAGVVSRDEVEKAIDEPFHPDLVAADAAAAGDQVFISDTDMAYSRKLATFGAVELPPPSFMAAVRSAEKRRVPIHAIDLNDDEYTLVFVDNVTYWQLVKHSRKVKSMRRYKARNPTDMATEWDRRIRSIKGFKVLERERERKMAMELVDQLDKHDKVLAVIDTMCVEGILEHMTKEMKA